MIPETISSLSGWRFRKLVALVLCVTISSLGVPLAEAFGPETGGDRSVPRHVLLRNGDGLVRIDLSDVVANHDAVAAGAGSMTITVEKALFADEGDGAGPPAFRFDELAGPSTADFEIMDNGLTPDVPSPGRSLADVQEWHPVVAATVTATPWSVSVEFRVGADAMTVVLPREADGGGNVAGEAGAVEVIVNGTVWQADPAFVFHAARTMAEHGVVPDFETPDELLDLVESFGDRGRFVNGAAGLELILGALAERLRDSIENHPDGCWMPCSGCGLALVGYGLSLAGLVAACGVTLGATCVVAFIGISLGKTGAALACINCGKCLSPEQELGEQTPELQLDGCPCKGQPNCDCAEGA